MSARHRLNAAAINGALVVAALLALVARSGWVFLIALGAMIVSSVVSRDIR